MKHGLDGINFLKFRFSEEVLSDKYSDREKTAMQTKELIEIESLNSDSIVLDIGANYGEVERVLSPVGCKVYAFEPHPLFFSMLEKNYADNDNIVLSNSAIWKTNEKKTFYFKRAASALNGGATLMSEKTNITDLSLNVEVTCLDVSELIATIDKPIDVLKMDVEGAEYEILQRLYESGAYKNVKSIYFEDHSRKMPSNVFRQLKANVLESYKNENISLYWW
ncbi:MAG: FkbM family methyltransferase [Candidatus Peribacter sp.]|jgi:FkbM family methyltransferase|nr:FkbM family methyltransferase [Candidatus Peribacter sp.]MBT6049867.1 FkbM family methyltransferase [Candidatus Scalindua sp.]